MKRCLVRELRGGYLILEDGTVGVGYTLRGFEEEALSAEAYEHYVAALAHALRPFPTGTILQKLDIYYPHAGRLRHQPLLYLCYTPHQQPYAPHTTFFIQGHTGLAAPLAQLSESLSLLSTLATTLEALLPTAWHVRRLTDQENLQWLYAYANLSFATPPAAFEHTLTCHKGVLQLGTHHVGAVSMQAQADAPQYTTHNQHGVTAPFAWPLAHALRCPHITVQVLRWQDTEALLRHTAENLTWGQGTARTARTELHNTEALDELAAFETTLRQRAEILTTTYVHVLVFAHSPTALTDATEATRKAFHQMGIVPLVETYDVANLFFGAMPACAVQLYRGVPMALETALVYLNPTTARQGSDAGIALFDRYAQPLHYDPFNTALDNQHAFVFGPSGAGKSFLNGKMIKERYEAGHLVLVIDSGGTYKRLFEALGGTYIAYDPDKPLGLNPFLAPPTAEHLHFLLQLVGKMWKGNLTTHPLSEAEKTLLLHWLTAYYAALAPETTPTLTGFYRWLQDRVAAGAKEVTQAQRAHLFNFDEFFVVLAPFAYGCYSAHFNAADAPPLTDARLVCFELEALKRHTKLYPLVVQILFAQAIALSAAHPHKQKFIDIEEGWTMLDDMLEETIEAFFRKGRKNKLSIRLITQSIEEIEGSRIAGAMKNNASTSILLYNDKASSRAAMGAFLGLTPLELEQYASLRRAVAGGREVLIKEMDKSHVWLVKTSRYEHALLTSQPDERQRIEALAAAKGGLQKGIAAWIAEQGGITDDKCLS